VEYRSFDAITSDGWRARLRLRVMLPKPAGRSWRAYVSNEIFNDEGGRLADQNRLFAGAMIASSPTWTTDVFLGWRHVSGNTVFDDSIIGGFGFRVDF
jgi:hypothetical protein